MGIGYPPHRKQGEQEESSLQGDDFFHDVLSVLEEDAGFDGDESSPRSNEVSGQALLLLEENARLRGLVVMLSGLVFSYVADRS